MCTYENPKYETFPESKGTGALTAEGIFFLDMLDTLPCSLIPLSAKRPVRGQFIDATIVFVKNINPISRQVRNTLRHPLSRLKREKLRLRFMIR